MGRLSRLRAEGKLAPYRVWIIGVKNDFSYSQTTIVEGQESTERVVNVQVVPLCDNSGNILEELSKDALIKRVNEIIDALPEKLRTDKELALFKSEIYAFELRNHIGESRRFGTEWYQTKVLSEEKINLKPRIVGRLL